MITVPISANINNVDAPSGATLNTLNVDLRQQPNAGGFFEADVASSGVAAGSVTIPATLTIIDSPTGSTNVDLNVDFRQQPNAGGFMEARVASALIAYAGASAPTAPVLGTAASGTQGARNETFAYTYVDANGNESMPSPSAAVAVGANNVATGTSPGASTGAVKYNVYGAITGNQLTLQQAGINIGTGYQELATGLTTTGRGVPVNSTLVAGAVSVIVSQGGALAQGAATVTIQQ